MNKAQEIFALLTKIDTEYVTKPQETADDLGSWTLMTKALTDLGYDKELAERIQDAYDETLEEEGDDEDFELMLDHHKITL
jgi:hypothetical protein